MTLSSFVTFVGFLQFVFNFNKIGSIWWIIDTNVLIFHAAPSKQSRVWILYAIKKKVKMHYNLYLCLEFTDYTRQRHLTKKSFNFPIYIYRFYMFDIYPLEVTKIDIKFLPLRTGSSVVGFSIMPMVKQSISFENHQNIVTS